MAEVVIIDYGMGNIHSVYKSILKVIDKNSTVTVSYTHLTLPTNREV